MNIQLDPQFTQYIKFLGDFKPPHTFIRFTRNAPSNKEYGELYEEYYKVARHLEIALKHLENKEIELRKFEATNEMLNDLITEQEIYD